MKMVCERGTTSFKLCRCSCRWKCKCLIPRDEKPRPPFNSSVKTGVKLGMHPLMMMNLPEAPAPGSYDPSPIVKKCPVTSWKREEEMKEFAATMGGNVLEKYQKQRKIMREGRGPGTHEVPQWLECYLDKKCTGIHKNASFGTADRFKSNQRFSTPGPGYTGKDHNPFFYMEQNRFKNYTTIPSFEYDGFVPRFRKKERSWSLPCNRYNIKYPNCQDNLLKKVRSKRGSYDLFEGPGKNWTMAGKLAQMGGENQENWPMKFPGEIDRLLHRSNHFKGLWAERPRYPKKPSIRSMLEDLSLCYKDPDEPGPGHYDPKLPTKSRNMMGYPFDSNVLNVRPIGTKEIKPGPTRYKINNTKSIRGGGWTWVFKSKTGRTMGSYLPEKFNAF